MGKKKFKSAKGFTLIEMIIALGIIGVLLLVMLPAWSHYIQRSNTRTANNKAKVIFNAAQTQCIKQENIERTMTTGQYMGSGDFYFYWHNGTGTSSTDGSSYGGDAEENAKFARAINNLYGDQGTYKVFISNYRVRAVVFAKTDNDRYVGAYPNSLDNIDSATASAIRTTRRVAGATAADLAAIAL